MIYICIRLCNLENVISHFDLFGDIGGPRLCTRHVMNKNGLIFPMCSSMTLHKGLTIYNFWIFESPAITWLDCTMTLEVFFFCLHYWLHGLGVRWATLDLKDPGSNPEKFKTFFCQMNKNFKFQSYFYFIMII